MSDSSYDRSFIEYAAQSSAYSARAISAILWPMLGIRSVLDVGCAAGTWLRTWKEQGAQELHGVDGDYVDRQLLEISAAEFTPVDLNKRFDLSRRFDLVQSLEVAEHIDSGSSDLFVENLANHARSFVLFSAAPPGQGGEYHVNECPYEFWRAIFKRHGFVAFDCVRPLIRADKRISYWYRYNTFLYVRREALKCISPRLNVYEIREGMSLQDNSPLSFRLRKAVVKRLPYPVQHKVARFKSRWLRSGRI